jgi:hypothetical protein
MDLSRGLGDVYKRQEEEMRKLALTREKFAREREHLLIEMKK